MTNPTKQQKGVRSVVGDRARRDPLTAAFYKQHRDTLQEENGRLRERIKNLEATIRAGKQRAEQAVAELTL